MPSSAFSEVHPQFADNVQTFQLLRDSFLGERHIKSKGTQYLPPTAGQIEFGQGKGSGKTDGDRLYQAYKMRAVYHDDFKRTVRALMGLMHREDAVIELPPALEGLRTMATPEGETLQVLLRRINEQQFVKGRFGLQLDVDANRPLPYIVGWYAESIRNWNVENELRENEIQRSLKWALLDESRFEPNANMLDVERNYSWTQIQAYRRLALNDAGQYVTQVERDGQTLPEVVPQLQGRAFERIPFVVANSTDLLFDIDEPPLEGLANLMLAVYRGEADYREALHRTGQDTLVLIGAPMPEDESGRPVDRLVGSNAVIEVPIDGDAKYIGVSGQGLAEMREAMANDRKEAGEYGGTLFDSERGAETGEALNMRADGKTATLLSIAKTGAAALEQILRDAAEWIGANPDDVTVQPNLDFLSNGMSAEELASLMGSKMMGAPLSLRTIHGQMQKRDLTEMEYEDELAEIAAEETLVDPNADSNADNGGDNAGEDDDEPNDDGDE